jgi:hypothetical protein
MCHLCFSLDTSSAFIFNCSAAYIYASDVNIMDLLKSTIGSRFLLLTLAEMVGRIRNLVIDLSSSAASTSIPPITFASRSPGSRSTKKCSVSALTGSLYDASHP